MNPLRTLSGLLWTVWRKKPQDAAPSVLTPRKIGETFYDFASARDKNARESPGSVLPGTLSFLVIFTIGAALTLDGFIHGGVYATLQILPGILCVALGLVGLVGVFRYGKSGR